MKNLKKYKLVSKKPKETIKSTNKIVEVFFGYQNKKREVVKKINTKQRNFKKNYAKNVFNKGFNKINNGIKKRLSKVEVLEKRIKASRIVNKLIKPLKIINEKQAAFKAYVYGKFNNLKYVKDINRFLKYVKDISSGKKAREFKNRAFKKITGLNLEEFENVANMEKVFYVEYRADILEYNKFRKGKNFESNEQYKQKALNLKNKYQDFKLEVIPQQEADSVASMLNKIK